MLPGTSDFVARARAGKGALLALGAGLLSCGAPEATDAPRPNVLLISIDSTRKDLLGAYGRRPAHAPELSPSPTLDHLAQQGVLFEDASSTTSWTLPAHVSMLTGLPALVHAVDIDMQTPNPALKNLAEMLSAEGYRTAGFFSGPYLDPRFGFARGFDRYEACFGDPLQRATDAAGEARRRMDALLARSAGADVAAAGQALGEAEGQVEQLSHKDVSSAAVTRSALEVLDAAAGEDQPFFLFLHYFDAHYDYTPPAPFDQRFDADYAGDIDGADFITNPEIATPIEGDPFQVTRTVSDRDLEHIAALYEGELAWIDQELGRVFERLDELGLAQDTLVIVTADHGDEFFEHGGLGHRKTLFEEVLQVPLIVRYPGHLEPGTRVAQPVSILSIVPTVLDALQIESELPLGAPSLLAFMPGRGAPPVHGLLGRLVYTLPATQGFGTANGGRGSVPVLRIFLTETYRKGSIKVIRRRQWTEFQDDDSMPDAVRESLEERRQHEQSVEDVRWTDVALHPREAGAYYSKSFEDPGARAVLQEFHDLYPRLLRLRREAGETQADGGQQSALSALGYADGGAPDLATEAFEVPPPGKHILEE
ncbi:MAG: arylsulfatase A-like enzyme [Chlamydiales bacterium]|jgi:arylsulfatase A-like enzyme